MLVRHKAGVMSVVAVSVALAGCASVEDFSTNPEKQKTRQGTAIGAASGIAIGLIAGGGWKGALIGAGVGALAGGAAGSYMDKQEAKLRQQMAGTGVEVVRMGDNLTLDMPGNVTFAFDSAKLNPQFNAVLDKVGQTLVEYNKTVIQIAGHTDSTGSARLQHEAFRGTRQQRQGLSRDSRRAGGPHGHDRRGAGLPDRAERHRGGSCPEPPRRDHDRAGDQGNAGAGEAGLVGLSQGTVPTGDSPLRESVPALTLLPRRPACGAS